LVASRNGGVSLNAARRSRAKKQPGRINRHFGGRGVYFDDPNGHLFEIITRPYGDPADI